MRSACSPLLRRALRYATAVALLPGCGYDVWSFDSCAIDPESCSSGGGWQIVPGCDTGQPLQVHVGHGDAGFVAFDDGTAPHVYDASGAQGSSTHHVLAGVRIEQPTPGHARFLVTVQACSPGYRSSYDPIAMPGAPTCTGAVSETQLVLQNSLIAQADGSLQRGNVRVFVQGPPLWLALRVQEECGREGLEVRAF